MAYKKNGHLHTGKQSDRCIPCGRQFVLQFDQRLMSDTERALIESFSASGSRCTASAMKHEAGVGMK
jgi:hypothetical protein